MNNKEKFDKLFTFDEIRQGYEEKSGIIVTDEMLEDQHYVDEINKFKEELVEQFKNGCFNGFN